MISNYFLNHSISSEVYMSINEFDYNIFNSTLKTDLCLIKNESSAKDTVLFLPQINLEVSLFSLLFSNDLHLDKIIINNAKFNLNQYSQNENKYIEEIVSSLSNVNRKMSFSSVEFSNINLVDTNQIVVEDLNIVISNLIIDSNFLNIEHLSANLDTSYLHASCAILNENLIFNIKDSKIYSNSDFFHLLSLEQRNYQNIHFAGNLLANIDSVSFETEITYGASRCHFEIINKQHNTFIQIYESNLKFHDFDSTIAVNNYFSLDSLNFIGNLNLVSSDSLQRLAVGFFDTDYGRVDFEVNTDSAKKSHFICELLDFDIGSLTQNNLYGLMNSKLEFNHDSLGFTSFKADVSNVMFNNYNYHNIIVKAEKSHDLQTTDSFIINLDINDKNLKSNTEILLKSNDIYSVDTYLVSAKSNIKNINLHELHYLINDSLDFISADFTTNEFYLSFFDRNTILNKQSTHPIINIHNIQYEKNNSIMSNADVLKLEIAFDSINVSSSFGSMYAKLYNSDNNYIIHKLIDMLKPESRVGFSNFYLEADLTQASFFSDLFFPNIKLADTLYLKFDYKDDNILDFHLLTPALDVANFEFKNISITTIQDNLLEYNVVVSEVFVSNNTLLDDISLSMVIDQDNKGSYVLRYSSGKRQSKESVIQGGFDMLDDSFLFNFSNNSFVHFSNQDWSINPDSEFILQKNDVFLKNFAFYLDNQIVGLEGSLHKPMSLTFSFDDFDVNHFNPLISNNSIYLDGVLDGSVVFNQASFPMLSGDFELNNFTCNNVLLGRLKLMNLSNALNDSVYINGVIESESQTMSFLTKYPLDNTKTITTDIEMTEFPVAVLDPFIKPISNLKGKGTGNLHIYGPLDSYYVSGQTKIDSVEFSIPYLNTHYSNNNMPLIIDFKNDSMFVEKFIFSDSLHDTKARFNGALYHKSFKDMSYQLTIDSDSLFALNTKYYDNEHYYGDIFLKGDMLINGTPNNITLNINGETQSGSKLMIPLSKSKEIRENQFIQFSGNKNVQSSKDILNKKSNFTMNFNLDINNNAEIQLIFDEEIGDVIKGYGDGELMLKIKKTGEFEVFGDFFIEEGNYLFTLQDVITKSFDIENGGMIRFNGNPYSALIDLNLLYNVQASLNPLNPDYDRKVKSPVICRMKMSEDLLSPDINFFIDIPNSDQIIETSLETITNTDQKLLEQFLYLLIANSFLVENDPSIDYLGNTLATTGTELLSNQLSNWLSQTTDAFDLGFKWVPGTGDSLSYQQVELAVSKKFLDDRVVVNGNVGTPPDQSEANIVGDVDIEYDFFKDGRLKFRVFNRAKDYDPLASESLGYEQGFGIFFKKQFNSFRDLFRRKKKEKK